MSEIDMSDPAALAAEYMDVQSRIDDLEGRAVLLKANLQVILQPETLTPRRRPSGSTGMCWCSG